MSHVTGNPWKDIRLSGKAEVREGMPVTGSKVKTVHGDVLFALIDRHAALVVPISRETSIPAIEGHNLVLQERWLQGVRCLTLTCMDNDLEDVFGDLCQTILSRLEENRAPEKAVMDSLEDYRNLLKLPREGKIDHNRLLGLAGELIVLKQCLENDPNALEFWKGPDGARHDFIFPSNSLETKTAQREDSHAIIVNSLEQMQPLPGLGLWLAHVILNKRRESSLYELIGEVERLLPKVGKSRLHDLLDKAGTRGLSDRTLKNWTFGLSRIDWYHVVDDFPRILPEDLPGGHLPGGVGEVTYSIDLRHAVKFLQNDHFLFPAVLFAGGQA